jgi:hypothetical protein
LDFHRKPLFHHTVSKYSICRPDRWAGSGCAGSPLLAPRASTESSDEAAVPAAKWFPNTADEQHCRFDRDVLALRSSMRTLDWKMREDSSVGAAIGDGMASDEIA